VPEHLQRAAILGQAGGVWATSQGYELSSAEQKAIVNTLKTLKNPEGAQAQGIRLAGEKFFTILVTERSVYGKKGANGCVLVLTKQAVLVAEYEAPVQQHEAVGVVEGLADHLTLAGY